MRYRMRIEYDGTDFHGWQIQPDQPTVQEALEKALEVVLKTRPQVVGSGRTDAGVHAAGQIAHFDTELPVDSYKLRGNLNGLLPDSIVVTHVKQTTATFHARFDAHARHYFYRVTTLPTALERRTRVHLKTSPDFDVMNDAATRLLGRHHFGAFCRTQSETTNRICTVAEARWVPETREGRWVFSIRADRFLHGMVRAIVGTLLQIGQGNRAPESLDAVLASQDRREAGPAAPAHGLVLHKVHYPETETLPPISGTYSLPE